MARQPEELATSVERLPPEGGSVPTAAAVGDVLRWSRGAHPAIIFEGCAISYEELDDESDRLAAFLQAIGLEPATRASLLLGNSPLILTAYFGIFKAGLVANPINVNLTAKEIAYILEHSESKLVVTTDEYVETLEAAVHALEAPPKVLLFGKSDSRRLAVLDGRRAFEHPDARPSAMEIDPATPALLLYTSGTSAAPKGVMLTHGNLVADAVGLQKALDIGPEHRTLCFMPLFHCNALVFSHLTSFLAGSTVVLCSRFSARAHWALVSTYRVNSFSCPPSVLAILLARQDERREEIYGGLEYVKVGSAPLARRLAERFEEAFGHDLILEGYGLTEATSTNILNPRGARRLGSIGKPVPGHEIRIVDSEDQDVPVGEVGELLIRAPTVMREYFKDAAATAAALRGGWLHTGDVGYADVDGYLYLVGREKEMIIRGGENISPVEVESVIADCPGVRDAGVVGLPDPIWGEEVVAVIVPREGVTPTDVIEFCRRTLAPYKVPKRVVFVSDLERSQTGKIQRRRLREMVQRAGATTSED